MFKRNVGILLIVFSIFIALFTAWVTEDIKKYNQYLHKDCQLPADICPFNTLLPLQSIVGTIISIAMAGIGLYFIVSSSREKKITVVSEEKVAQVIKNLRGDEKTAYDTVVASDGTIFQSDLVEKSGLDKVKVSRVLDRLEGKGLIDRKRRGMSNVIVLRH